MHLLPLPGCLDINPPKIHSYSIEKILQVITPSAGGPADKAGIQPRDYVAKIDGRATAGISLYDAGELLQGTEGSQVTTKAIFLAAS